MTIDETVRAHAAAVRASARKLQFLQLEAAQDDAGIATKVVLIFWQQPQKSAGASSITSVTITMKPAYINTN